MYYYFAQNHFVIGSGYTGNGGTCNEYGDISNMYVASIWNGIPHDTIFLGNFHGFYSGDDILISYSTFRHEMYYSYSASDAYSVTLTNFSILGNVFPKVYCSNGGLNSTIYEADNIGIVKWVFNDTINGQRTWNLLRYHVINP